MHSMHDPRDTTREARVAFLAKFDREVDPDERLPEPERRRRVAAARAAAAPFCARLTGRALSLTGSISHLRISRWWSGVR